MKKQLHVRAVPILLALSLSISIAGAQSLDGLARAKSGRSRAVTSADPDPNSNRDRIGIIKPGETRVLADIKGPAVIRHIWLTFNEARPNWIDAAGSAAPNEIVLRMTWDDASTPAVESPLGDFFGVGFGLRRELESLPVQVEGGDGYNCFWPMPFFKRGVVTVTNESAKSIRSLYYHIDYTEEDSLPEDSTFFCAQYRQEFPEKPGSDYLVLDAEGPGHYVGTVMSARSRSPMWFGEGDAKFFVDGDPKPTIQGTGTEDYFLMAWALNEALYPYFGCTYMSSDFESLGTEYSLYRWHIEDAVRFRKSLRFEIEHKGWISADETESGKVEGHVERDDDIATVAFWYQVGQPKRFTSLPPLADRIFPLIDVVIEGGSLVPASKSSPGLLELQKGYDWTGSGQLLFRPVGDGAVLETEFDVTKEEYRGVILRMTHADDYGIWRVFLDGKDVLRSADDPAGPGIVSIDLYAKDLVVKDHYLGSYALSPGKHTLRFELVGRNPLSRGSAMGLDSVRLRERWAKKRKFLS